MTKWLAELLRKVAAWMNRCVPAYEPALWNDGGPIQRKNNCYNYACNVRTDTFADPGRATRTAYASVDCDEVGKAARSDGLRPVDCDEGCGCRDCCHQVALVVWPGGADYHWYRKDKDGRWSHKPGRTPATNLDDSGNPILDPRTADRGPYTVFCGCFCVCRERVRIE